MTERSTGPAPASEPSPRDAGKSISPRWSGTLRAALWLLGPADRLARLWYALRSAAVRRRSVVLPLQMGVSACAGGVAMAPCTMPAVVSAGRHGAPAPTGRSQPEVMRLIESVLLPGLVAWHQSLPAVVDERRAIELARRLVGPTGTGVRELLCEHYAGHGSLHRLFTGLVEPAARRLGDLWSSDDCTESEVTIGLCRLLSELRQLDGCGSRVAGHAGRAALVVPLPGEPHMLGAALDAESLWQAGWLPQSEYPETDDALQTLVAARHYDVLCISLSPSFRRSHRLDRLAQFISRARAVSLNPNLVVVVSGRAFHEDRSAARRVGADGSSRWASRFELLH
ncbi:photosynthesis regulator [Rubrivivax sp. JA1024]|nr:photosynthesis regulator [Rubrivivax sp. JA1024]